MQRGQVRMRHHSGPDVTTRERQTVDRALRGLQIERRWRVNRKFSSVNMGRVIPSSLRRKRELDRDERRDLIEPRSLRCPMTTCSAL
jgi:hypothetical protein